MKGSIILNLSFIHLANIKQASHVPYLGQGIWKATVCCFTNWKTQLIYQPNVWVLIITWIHVHVQCTLYAAYLPIPILHICTHTSNVIYLPNLNRRVVRSKALESDLPEILASSSELCDHSGHIFPHSRNGHRIIWWACRKGYRNNVKHFTWYLNLTRDYLMNSGSELP